MRANTPDSFLAKLDRSCDCWIWVGYINPGGYGRTVYQGKSKLTHRLAWELFRGEIPDGAVIDHICHVRRCANPDHLRVATPAQNAQHRKGAQPGSRSGVRGVYWEPKIQMWRARLKVNGKNLSLGCYRTIDEARGVVEEARAHYYDFPDYREATA